MIKIIKVKLNVDMLGYPIGSILTLINQKYSGDGIFLSSYFRKRIKDSKLDNCLTILKCEIENEKTSIQELEDDYKEVEKEVAPEIKTIESIKSKKRGRPKSKRGRPKSKRGRPKSKKD